MSKLRSKEMMRIEIDNMSIVVSEDADKNLVDMIRKAIFKKEGERK